MVTPLLHLGLGYDDLLLPALVEAGFRTKDTVLVARTDGNLSWVRRHAPDATVVRLPYAEARGANVITGLAQPVAATGDAIFAGSMGGGVVSYLDALANNRKHILSLPNETVLCPGHGPMTTVDEEKRHNPFFPEFQKD